MDLSQIGRAALEAREGCRLTAYRDSVGTWTIGIGHTTAAGGLVVTPGLAITRAQADALFATDLATYVEAVRRALAKSVPQPFFDACCSLCYNVGPANFAHSSVVRLANAGDLPAAAEAFLRWNRPAAILPRRQGERDQAALTGDGPVFARRGDPVPIRPMVIASANATQPAPSGGLFSAPHPVPANPGFWSRLHALLSRKVA